MKKLSLLALLALVAATNLPAQKTVTEVAKPTTTADDAKSNSDKVPDVYAISTKFDRIVVLRFKFNTDLLAGLEKMVKEQKIRNAVFSSRTQLSRRTSSASMVTWWTAGFTRT